MSKQSVKHESPGELVVRLLGGVRSAARTLGFDSHMVVYHWASKGGPIPSHHLLHVRDTLAEHGHDVTVDELIEGRDSPAGK